MQRKKECKIKYHSIPGLERRDVVRLRCSRAELKREVLSKYGDLEGVIKDVIGELDGKPFISADMIVRLVYYHYHFNDNDSILKPWEIKWFIGMPILKLTEAGWRINNDGKDTT